MWRMINYYNSNCSREEGVASNHLLLGAPSATQEQSSREEQPVKLSEAAANTQDGVSLVKSLKSAQLKKKGFDEARRTTER